MNLNAQMLVGYLRAEYSSSSRWRVASFLVGLVVTLPAVVSVLTTDAKVLYNLAVLNFVLLVTWTWVNYRYTVQQSAAHFARRAAIIVIGLGEELSSGEKRRLLEKFTVSVEVAEAFQKDDYYATSADPGPAKLLECLEESAFYSSRLHKSSATAWVIVVFAYVAIFTALSIFMIPTVDSDFMMMTVRAFFAGTIFILSANVVGSLSAHWRCAAETSEVLNRIEVSKSRQITTTDALLILEDYTSAIQSAPEILPFIYKAQEANLNMLWKSYINS